MQVADEVKLLLEDVTVAARVHRIDAGGREGGAEELRKALADKANLVHVEILGQTYAVKAGADPGYVESLAAFVDKEMKDVSRASGAVDSVRVAVLAALNLADEVFRLRRELEEARSRAQSAPSADERIARLATSLGAALGE